MITKETFFEQKRNVIEVEIPELKDSVYVREFSIAEFYEVVEEGNEIEAQSDGVVAYKWIIAGICDKDGNPIFTDDDAEAIKAMPLTIANRLYEAAHELNLPIAIKTKKKK